MINLNLILLCAVIVFAIGNGGVFCHKLKKMQKRQSFQVLTFNAALFDTRIGPDFSIQKNREERRDKLIDALNHAKADFVCLQEVWIAEDVAAIAHGVRKKYKYSFSDAHKGKAVESFIPPGEEPVCSIDSIGAIFVCIFIFPGCPPLGPSFIPCALGCFFDRFGDPFEENCFTCIITAFPSRDVIFKDCFGEGDVPHRKMNTKGLMILSKKKLSETRSVNFFPSTTEFIERGYLSANVKGIASVCTHLSVDSIDLPFYPEVELIDEFGFTSYEDQNAYETQLLLNGFGSIEKLILLGDFNSGTASAPGVQDFFMESFLALSAVFDTMTVTQCTLCSIGENPLSLSDDESYIIDHVFTKGVCISQVKRIFTQRDYSVLEDKEVQPISDHYGVKAKILPPKECST